MERSIEAIIWDCDGVLVDSELVSCSHAANYWTQRGYPMTTQDYIAKFMGRSSDYKHDELSKIIGTDSRKLFDADEYELTKADFIARELQASPHIHDVLESTNHLPRAVASVNKAHRIEQCLNLTKLKPHLAPHIYDGATVERRKPAPDIYLHAANELDIDIKRALVVEDSTSGAKAGLASGATVVGYIGGSHILDKDAHAKTLKTLGVHYIIENLKDLPNLLKTPL